MLDVARAVEKDFDFLTFDRYALSGADMFALLTDAATALVQTKALPAAIRLATIDGPTRTFNPSTGQLRSSSFSLSAFASAVRDTAEYCRVHRRMPDEVWIGAENIPPVDYLATLGYAVEQFLTSGTLPTTVDLKSVRFTADRHVAEDSPKLWGWIIFPEGFTCRGDGFRQAPGLDVEAGAARSSAQVTGTAQTHRLQFEIDQRDRD